MMSQKEKDWQIIESYMTAFVAKADKISETDLKMMMVLAAEKDSRLKAALQREEKRLG